MPAPEFRFGMTLSGASDKTHVLVDVFRSVLGHVGLKGEAGDRLLDQVMKEYRQGPAGGECTLRIAAHAGEIQISFSKPGRDFHTACPVPVR